jgi:catechol 2,3-dioxygenase-like lactoylglutathione lyase family enzyme
MEVSEVASHQRLVVSKGEAAGRISGINHVVFVCKDMDRSLRFYRDLLGLKLVQTQPAHRVEYERQYFFEVGNGEVFSLYQVGNCVEDKEVTIVPQQWPEIGLRPSIAPQKMDHFSFDVETKEDLEWFHRRLEQHGVPVSGVIMRDIGQHVVVGSIYFYDPDNNPLEIATSLRGDPRWESVDPRVFLKETNPVPSAFE